LNLDNRLIKI